jgi:acetyltransferase-like isoleucine patch superfamily enzyme
MPEPGTITGHLRRLARTISPRQLLSLWLEDWVGGLLRPIPGLTGLALRYGFYRCLFARLDGFSVIMPGVRMTHTYGIRAGRGFGVNSGSFLDGRGGLTFGDHVLIGPNVLILSSMHRWDDPSLPIHEQGHRLAPTTIGDHVWIGGNATINPGITIAPGTVVGAGAVVTADTQPYTIIAGVPAREIGTRPRPVPAERAAQRGSAA